MFPQPTANIVDDDSALRDSVALWLGMRGIRCRAFESAEQFLAAANPGWRGCVLVDLRLDGLDGLQLQAKMAECGIAMPVIFVTGHGDVATTRNALKAGAYDFIEKPVDNDRLVEVVKGAMASDSVAARRKAQSSAHAERMRRLTRRERQVLDQVIAGRHNREIASELGISPRTVEVYKARMMDKLDARNTTELVKLMLEQPLAA